MMAGWRRTWTGLKLARLYLVVVTIPLIMTAHMSRVAFVTAAVAVTVGSVVFFVGLVKWRRAQANRSEPGRAEPR
jgi:predicted membrane channel-forming protein YqfA (hemolysin III family)